MAQFPVAFVGMLAGVVLTALAAWVARRYALKVRRRALASALVGELVGILRTIETEDLENCLSEANGKRDQSSRFPKQTAQFIPVPVVFEANADRLGLFEPSLARKIANLYALLRGVNGSLSAVAGDDKLSEATLAELQESLTLADDVLHQLRPLL